ncbi:MAG: multidrug efflux pump subunit AcrB [Flavobacteriaceae bacterium]|jgi:multidrug efflux pump subunit AcrB
MKKNISHTSHIVLLSILVIVVLGVYMYGRSFVHKKDNNVAVLNGQIEKQKGAAEQVNLLRKTAQETSEDRISLDTYFISEGEIVEYLAVLEDIGQKKGIDVSIKNVSQKDGDKTGKNTSQLQVVVQVEGSFKEVRTYLKDLEDLPYLIDFTQTAFSQDFETETDKDGKIKRSEYWILSATLDLYSFISE